MAKREPPVPEGPYLEHCEPVQVRFQEVDAMHVVWHGHYMAYFEDGRRGFGRRFGLSYEALRDAGIAAPVVRIECDYRAPAQLGDILEVTTRLHVDAAAVLDFTYLVRRAGEATVLAWGRTRQVFTSFQGTLVLTRPALLEGLYQRWQAEMVRTDG